MFLAVSVGYTTMFWSPGKILKFCDSSRRILGRHKNSSFLVFQTVFVGYNTLFWGLGKILKVCDPRTLTYGIFKTRRFGHFLQFSWAIVHCFGVRGRFDGPSPKVHEYLDVVKTHRFGHFWPIAWHIARCFGGLGPILKVSDPCYTNICISWKALFLAFLAVFVGYSTPFWGPRTILKATDPR